MKQKKPSLKKGCLEAVLAAALFSSPGVYAQIAVVDATQIQHHIQAIVQLKEQIKQLHQQYKAITGSRSLGDILNDAAFADYLPAEWRLIYDDLRRKGYAGLEGDALKIHALYQLFDSCAFLQAKEQRLACQAQASKPAQDKAFGMQAYDTARQRLAQIEGLMEKINATDDLKSIAELQGRIAAEQATIQNEKIKLEMHKLVSKAEAQLQTQRMHEIHMREAAKRGGLNVQPMTFKSER